LPDKTFTYDVGDVAGLHRRIQAAGGTPELPFDRIELERVEVGPDVLPRLPAALAGLGHDAGPVQVVTDTTGILRDGVPLKPHIRDLLAGAGYDPIPIELAPGSDGLVHASSDRVAELRDRLDAALPVVIVGSGTITDIAKHACLALDDDQPGRRIPLVSVATANSVVAYSSKLAVISVDGVKRTTLSRLPQVVLCDTTLLAGAPLELTRSGMGDIAAMYTAFPDWRLACVLGLDDWDTATWEVLTDVRAHFAPWAAEMGAATEAGTEVLAKLLTLCGLAMTYAGDSAPLSGYEHVNGHVLDMTAEHAGRATALHGAQVGVATLPCSIAQVELLAIDPAGVDVDTCYPDEAAMEAVVRDAFTSVDPTGAMADECWRDYRTKLAAWRDARPRFEALLADWDAERARIAGLTIPPAEVATVLAAAGHPLRYEELSPSIPEAEGRWAFAHAHLMRKRITSGDLLHFLGRFGDRFIDSVFATAETLRTEATVKEAADAPRR
jgi:glycerol-1-phosphate dehydrogenase [NAD(P)+]